MPRRRAEFDDALRRYGSSLMAMSESEVTAMAKLTDASKAFFALDDAEKARYAAGDRSDWTGYMPPRSTGLSGRGDDFERIAVASLPVAPPPHIKAMAVDHPDLFASCREVFDLLVGLCRQAGRFLSAILGLDPQETDDIWFDRHSSKLAVNHYPHASADALAAHSDFGGLSIIYAGDDPSGLEIYEPGEGGQGWHPVAGLQADTALLVLGELYSYWTDDRWPATPHRVVRPRAGRISIVLFHTPAEHLRLGSVSGSIEPVVVGDMTARLKRDYRVQPTRRLESD